MRPWTILSAVVLVTAFVTLTADPAEAANACNQLKNPDCPGAVCVGKDPATGRWTYCTPSADRCDYQSDCCDGTLWCPETE